MELRLGTAVCEQQFKHDTDKCQQIVEMWKRTIFVAILHRLNDQRQQPDLSKGKTKTLCRSKNPLIFRRKKNTRIVVFKKI